MRIGSTEVAKPGAAFIAHTMHNLVVEESEVIVEQELVEE
jgi:hypothetical protein